MTSDVAFYTGNLQALKGLNNLDLNMAEIWEQKRWWSTGSSHLALTTDWTFFKAAVTTVRWILKTGVQEKGTIESRGNWTRRELQGMSFSASCSKKQAIGCLCNEVGFFGLVVFFFFFSILSGNRLRFLWTKSKRTHSCNTAVVV